MAKYTVVVEMNIEEPSFDTVEEAQKWVNAYLDQLGEVQVPYFETVSWPTCAWRIYDGDTRVWP